ncbi:XRE family transcriptional regulator [Paenibacillaceae bacterium]|nr:XRE family transcriptional regulator [Paenibacillaceae bacterium]
MLRLRIGERIEELGLNTRQVSQMAGVRWNTVDDLAKNKAKHWSPENLEKIMKVLDIKSVEDLIEYKDEGSGE